MTSKHKHQHGFTLVELAIVMTIIGLLIGGILKGQELMLNARVTATIAQIRSYEAAATTFRDSYAALPGDMISAATRLPGCTTSCNPSTAAGGGGNSIVGSPTWSSNWTTTSQWVALVANNPTVGGETTLFWMHLLQADLISGVSTEGLTSATPQWGVTHPQARINGGFVVGYANGTTNPSAATTTTYPTGMVLAIINAPDGTLQGANAGQNPLTAGKAAQIDRKMDDGRPASGFVHAYGITASCLTAAGAPIYNEATTGNDCGLLFRIQG